MEVKVTLAEKPAVERVAIALSGEEAVMLRHLAMCRNDCSMFGKRLDSFAERLFEVLGDQGVEA